MFGIALEEKLINASYWLLPSGIEDRIQGFAYAKYELYHWAVSWFPCYLFTLESTFTHADTLEVKIKKN